MDMKRILSLFILTLILTACTNDSSEDKNTQKSETSAPETTEETKTETLPEEEIPEDDRLQFGESSEIDGIELTINDAEFTIDRIPDHFETFEYVIKLNVTYENNSDAVFPAGRDITVTVNDETEATYYDMEGTLLQDVNNGESVTGDIYYAFNGQPEKITAKFEPLLNTEGEHALFNVFPE